MESNSHSKAIRLLLLFTILTASLSLLYGLQYYAGGPLRLSVTSEIQDVTFSPDGALVAAAARDGRVRMWRIPEDWNPKFDDHQEWTKHNLTGAADSLVYVGFTADSASLVAVSQDGSICLWDTASAQLKDTLQNPNGTLHSADLARDGQTLATIGQDGFVHVWSLATGQIIQSIGPNENTQYAVALSADGALVAAGDDQEIQIWASSSGEPVQRLQGQWEDEEKQEDWLGHTHRISSLIFDPDGKYLVSGDVKGDTLIWDLEENEFAWDTRGHLGVIADLAFNAEGEYLVSGGGDNIVRLWRLPGGQIHATFQGHLGGVTGVAFGPVLKDSQGKDFETILSSGTDGSVRLWGVSNSDLLYLVWTQHGLTSVWAKVFGAWMLISGVLGFGLLWGLWRIKAWAHLGALLLYIIGPLLAILLPLLETTAYPIDWGTRIGIAWPLLLLGAWYVFLVWYLKRDEVAIPYEAPGIASLAQRLMTAQRTWGLRKVLFIGATWLCVFILLFSTLRRIGLDVAFMNKWMPFILKGARDTTLVSISAIVLAIILALLGALGRLSTNPVANGVSGFYISMIRGTPLLVQIYIWYLALPQIGLTLDPIPAGIMALGVNYGAYMTEIFRAGIQAINKGQHEAAQALGMSSTQTLRRIVLPQAFRIVIPPIGNDFVAMTKDSSLVSIMGVWELTFRAGKVGRQNFRNLETFIVAAAFYWLLTIIFQFFQGKLEEYMARGERR